MAVLFILLALLSLLVLCASLLLLPFKRWRAGALLRAKLSTLAFFAFLTTSVVLDQRDDGSAKELARLNQEAIAVGFENHADRENASAAGVSDPILWKTQKAEDVAKLMAAEKADAAAKNAAELAKQKDKAMKAANELKLEALCRKTLSCIGEKLLVEADVYCRDAVERLAKYQAEWTDGYLELKFSRYRWKGKKGQVITFVGDKVRFQNGFGAWQNMIYFCDVDIRSKRPVGVSAEPGRL